MKNGIYLFHGCLPVKFDGPDTTISLTELFARLLAYEGTSYVGYMTKNAFARRDMLARLVEEHAEALWGEEILFLYTHSHLTPDERVLVSVLSNHARGEVYGGA